MGVLVFEVRWWAWPDTRDLRVITFGTEDEAIEFARELDRNAHLFGYSLKRAWIS